MVETTQWTQITAHMWVGEYQVDGKTYYQVHDRSDLPPLNAGYSSRDEAVADAERYEVTHQERGTRT